MTLTQIQDRLWCNLSLANKVKAMLPPEITGQRLAALLCEHEIIDSAAVDDPEGFDNYRTMEAINAVAKALNEPLAS